MAVPRPFAEMPSSSTGGFSLIELLAVVAIIAILASLVFANRSAIFDAVENAKCLSNMRGLHGALAAYVQDKGTWPQEPENEDPNVFVDSAFWIRELTPFGVTREVWICPSINRISRKNPTLGIPEIHYSPALFDPGPNAPYQFSTQPWLVEVASVHRKGANVCFPDGSIRPLKDLLPEAPR